MVVGVTFYVSYRCLGKQHLVITFCPSGYILEVPEALKLQNSSILPKVSNPESGHENTERLLKLLYKKTQENLYIYYYAKLGLHAVSC